MCYFFYIRWNVLSEYSQGPAVILCTVLNQRIALVALSENLSVQYAVSDVKAGVDYEREVYYESGVVAADIRVVR